MNKLNNKGWGLSVFIAFIAILCLALLLIVVGAIKLGISSHSKKEVLPVTEVKQKDDINSDSGINDNKTENNLNVLDNYISQIVLASKNYTGMNENLINFDSGFVLTLKDLIDSNYVGKYQINGNLCSGYVIVSKIENNYDFNPFLNCGSSFISQNYDLNLDEIIE